MSSTLSIIMAHILKIRTTNHLLLWKRRRPNKYWQLNKSVENSAFRVYNVFILHYLCSEMLHLHDTVRSEPTTSPAPGLGSGTRRSRISVLFFPRHHSVPTKAYCCCDVVRAWRKNINNSQYCYLWFWMLQQEKLILCI